MTTQVDVVNVTNCDCDVYAGRGDGGKNHMLNTEVGEPGWLGNPFKMGEDGSREEAIEQFKAAFGEKIRTDADFRDAVLTLDADSLGCYCKPQPCHADTIAEFINRF